MSLKVNFLFTACLLSVSLGIVSPSFAQDKKAAQSFEKILERLAALGPKAAALAGKQANAADSAALDKTGGEEIQLLSQVAEIFGGGKPAKRDERAEFGARRASAFDDNYDASAGSGAGAQFQQLMNKLKSMAPGIFGTDPDAVIDPGQIDLGGK